jgi:hypothetical protein
LPSAAADVRAFNGGPNAMQVSTVKPARLLWLRAALLLLATLLAHAWVLDRVQRVLAGAELPRPGEAMTVSARLLPPADIVPMPVPVPPSRARPRPAAAAAPPVFATAAAPNIAEPSAGVDASLLPDVAELRDETAAVAPNNEAPAAFALNAERPAMHEAAVEAIEFEAAGSALSAALASLPVLNAALPSAAQFVYRTTNSDLRLVGGTTTLDWTLDGDRYRLRMATTAVGVTILELQSQGALRAFGLAPDRYTEARIRRGAVAANFDWGTRRVTFSARTHERPLPDGVQDRISFQFQLMLLGQARPERFRSGAQTLLWVAGRDDVDGYRLRSAGRDRTTTGIGELDTVKVERMTSSESDARIEVWLAPDVGWLPARLRFTDRHGRVTESVLESVSS